MPTDTPAGRLDPRRCPVCWTTFLPTHHNPRQRYCSPPCRVADWRRRRDHIHTDPTPTQDAIMTYQAVTAADIAEFLHHLAALRCHPHTDDDPAQRAAFLTRKAELLTQIADQHAVSDPAYAAQARQLAAAAHTATDVNAALTPLTP